MIKYLRNENLIIPESGLSFNSTAALEKQLLSLLWSLTASCFKRHLHIHVLRACFSNTPVKPKPYAILSGIIKFSFLKTSINCLVITLIACSHIPSVKSRFALANQLAKQHNWQGRVLPTKPFQLMSYTPAKIKKSDLLTVYIEGDGLAWRTRSIQSNDPSPINPLGLKLALAQYKNGQTNSNIAYLARPCQYTTDSNCKQRYWTSGRFAAEIIQASSHALNQLKKQSGASQLQLIGYSGGGAVAALLAAQRNDVIQLITVAGNLNHKKWTSLNHLAPLSHSLNPADYWQALSAIPQVHFIGGQDKIITKEISDSFSHRFALINHPTIVTLPDFNHHCCWADQWGKLSAAYLVH